MGKIEVIRGDKEFGFFIIDYFLSKGAKNNGNLTGKSTTDYYFINENNQIDMEYPGNMDLENVKLIELSDVIKKINDKKIKEMIKEKKAEYVDCFDDILSEMKSVHEKKNADYGNNFHKRYEKYGFLTALLRLTDKMERLENIYEKGEVQVKDESVEDTLLDLANYAVMTIVELRNNKKRAIK